MKLSQYLKTEAYMAAYGEFFGSPAGQALLSALAPFSKPAQPPFPLGEGQAEYILGTANGAGFMLDLIGSLRELQTKLGSKNQSSEPTYGEEEIMRMVYKYE